jgi:nicotinamidase-related amidase
VTVRALLTIDMQVGCFAGEPPRRDAAGTLGRINALAAAIRPRGRVVHVQHADDGDFAPGSPGWAFVPGLDRAAGDPVVAKAACDAFLETRLADELDGVDELVITGCATDFCVDTTVRAAAARGYQVIVPTDAHTTRDRPYLDAATIIAHHHAMWSDLLLPRGRRIRLASTAAILDA